MEQSQLPTVDTHCIEWAHAVTAQLGQDECVEILSKHGFGCQNQAIPTDWPIYYELDELREFVQSYLFPEAE